MRNLSIQTDQSVLNWASSFLNVTFEKRLKPEFDQISPTISWTKKNDNNYQSILQKQFGT